ncbi:MULTISPECIES: Lcl domain-containing protein [Vibrio]|uniref:Lcl domain-containing protein n=1 Tax=Vibrio TaxID=662 RepID=UPI000C9DA809|nr:DUF1566 domain-containing protein [Vibrio diazotrophicus]PNH95221.1 hypothetical protein C1O24_15825 [Vibrio diazotrophicus]
MKYLTLSLALVTLSAHTTEVIQECRTGTDLNPNQRFTQQIITTDMGDYKVVNDAATGLQWSYCFVGQELDANQVDCIGKPTVPYDTQTEGYANIRRATIEQIQLESKRLDGRNLSWRLPNIKELLSIYNEHCKPATYSMFSHSLNTYPEEIAALINTPLEHNNWQEYHTIFSLRDRGKAYQNHTVVSDTAVTHNNYMYYYTVNFNGWSTPIDKDRKSSGLLRLVRKIP